MLQIKASLAGLKLEQTKLLEAWEKQQAHLQHMQQYQVFLRDAKAIDAMSSAHEVSWLFDSLSLSLSHARTMEYACMYKKY